MCLPKKNHAFASPVSNMNCGVAAIVLRHSGWPGQLGEEWMKMRTWTKIYKILQGILLILSMNLNKFTGFLASSAVIAWMIAGHLDNCWLSLTDEIIWLAAVLTWFVGTSSFTSLAVRVGQRLSRVKWCEWCDVPLGTSQVRIDMINTVREEMRDQVGCADRAFFDGFCNSTSTFYLLNTLFWNVWNKKHIIAQKDRTSYENLYAFFLYLFVLFFLPAVGLLVDSLANLCPQAIICYHSLAVRAPTLTRS